MTCRCGMQFCYKCGGNYPNCYCKQGTVPVEQLFIPQPLPAVPAKQQRPESKNELLPNKFKLSNMNKKPLGN